MRRELAVAHEVQRGFLPSESPQLPHYDFFEFYEPANALGGDYYDYVELPRGRLAVVLGDVSGKGISASLLMAKLSAEARFCLISEPTPAAAIGRLNRIFCGSGWEDRFVTLVLAVLDPLENNVTLVNRRPHAAHPAPRQERRRTGGRGNLEPAAGRRSRHQVRARRLSLAARRFAHALHRRHHRSHERRRRSLRPRPPARSNSPPTPPASTPSAATCWTT